MRRAARLMRERAAAPVPPGPWESEFSDVIRTDVPFGSYGYVITECANITEARHIASWHPVVALAVADWLIDAADIHEPDGNPGKEPHSCTTCGWGWPCDSAENALAVARAYLGES